MNVMYGTPNTMGWVRTCEGCGVSLDSPFGVVRRCPSCGRDADGLVDATRDDWLSTVQDEADRREALMHAVVRGIPVVDAVAADEGEG